ncbi:MAG: transposase [Candidatus Heimdallarchaeota archaeon]|nr:transposase [Candidatus Heimdallarchaeota archaeon]
MAECHELIEGSKSYSAEEIMRVIFQAALRRRSIESMSETLRDEFQSPSADVIRKQVSEFYDKHSLDSLSHVFKEMFYTQVKKHAAFKKRRKPEVILAIDLHDEEFYGKIIEDEDKCFILYSKSKKAYAFQFATLSIVEIDGKWENPLTIDVMLNYKDRPRVEIIKEFIERLNLNVKIKLLTIDGGFMTKGIAKYLDEIKIPYLGRGRYSKKKEYPGTVNTNFEYDLAGYKVEGYLLLNKSRKKTGKEKSYKVLMISTSKKRYSIEMVRNLYKKRFRIENTYKQTKQVKIKSSSRNLKQRLFYWSISQYIELLWEFCKVVHVIQEMKDYLVRMDRFKDIVLELLQPTLQLM